MYHRSLDTAHDTCFIFAILLCLSTTEQNRIDSSNGNTNPKLRDKIFEKLPTTLKCQQKVGT